MEIYFNGKKEQADSIGNISELLKSKNIRPEIVTVELNGDIINKSEYDKIEIKDGDKIEVVFYPKQKCLKVFTR